MSSDSSLEARVRARLAALDAQGLLRSLKPPAGIDLCSNDYLNLANDPRLTARLIEGAAREGCGSTGSRLLRGERAAFTAIEQRFARFKGTERALYFSAGYLANVAVLTALTEEGDVIFSDEHNHASLIDGMRLSRARTQVFPHNDAVALRRLLEEAGASRGQRFIVVESLFSMEGDLAPLVDYASIARENGAVLVVDEAHAVGIYGERGSGLIEQAGIAGAVTVSINTAGKALGVSGAFVAGPSWAIEYLVQRARPFVFSTAPPPALADALDASLTVVEEEPERRERLIERSQYLRARLAAVGIEPRPSTLDLRTSSSQIVPIIIGDNERAVAVAAALQADGFDVRAIRPPSVPAGTSRLRIAVNAGLSHAVLDRFVEVLAVALKEIGLCAASS